MIVVKSKGAVSFIQAELDDFTVTKRTVKTYNIDDEKEARLAEPILNPAEHKKHKLREQEKKKKVTDASAKQKTIGGAPKKQKKTSKARKNTLQGRKARKQKAQSDIGQLITSLNRRQSKDKESKQSTQSRPFKQSKEFKQSKPIEEFKPSAKSVEPKVSADRKIAVVSKESAESKIVAVSKGSAELKASQASVPFVSEDIIMQFGKSGDLELLCPFCKDTLLFRFEDVDRRTYKNTRICPSCESINRASITMGNRFIFADFEKSRPEIAKLIRKLENPVQDEFGNAIYTYSFPNHK